jgi:gliding motility-associated lipoprotein GldH
MNIRTILTCLLISFFAASCSHVYKEYNKESFPAYIWNQEKEIVFDPTINDIDKSYKIILGIRYVFGFNCNSMVLRVKSISPSGIELIKDYEIKIKDEKNNYIGNCSGDLCDMEIVAEQNFTFKELGNYQYIIKHNSESEGVSGIIEVGLIIDKND